MKMRNIEMPDQKTINLNLGRLERFKEMFQVRAFYIQSQILHLNLESKGRKVPLHSHQTFEFSILMQGRIGYRVEGQPVELEEGDAIIIPPKTPHDWHMRDDSLILGFMLFISCQGDNSRQLLNLLKEGIVAHSYHIRQSPVLMSLAKRILAVAERRDPYTEERELCLTREVYTELIAMLVPFPGAEAHPVAGFHLRGESGNHLVDEAYYYVWDNSYRSISASEVAQHVGVGLNRLNCLFREHRGMTVGQAIALDKMTKAKELLEGSSRSIKDIASALGFEDTNYFCTFFRKHEGASASVFRTRYRG